MISAGADRSRPWRISSGCHQPLIRVAIPPAFSGKILYQALGFGGSGFELSTPTVVDVN